MIIMAIVTADYYANTYHGETVAASDWDRYDARAEQTILQITRGRAVSDSLPDALLPAVKNAVCAQIEYYVYNGIDIANAGRLSAGFSVGKVRVDSGAPTGARSMVCPEAVAILEQTGLLNPNVDVLGRPSIMWGWP